MTKTTTAQELQSLQELKVLITSTFSCVGYLRDLFSESCFEDDVHADISLKRMRRGASSQTDSLLDWIELGIMDAITKKYVIIIILSILLHSNNVLSS